MQYADPLSLCTVWCRIFTSGTMVDVSEHILTDWFMVNYLEGFPQWLKVFFSSLHTIKTSLHHSSQEQNIPLQPVIRKQKLKLVRWQTELHGPWEARGFWWAPKVDVVSEPFQSSRCIVHLLSWLFLQVWSHQLMSRTVFRLKQLWATYWENLVRGGRWLSREIQSKQKKNLWGLRGVWDEGGCKYFSTIKGNTNIINPVIMVQYMSSSLSVPPELLSPSTMSPD